MKESEKLDSILEKFSLVEPIPPDVRKQMINSRQDILKNCLKKVDNYPFFFGGVLFVFFLARKLKFKISLSTGKFIAITFYAMAAGAAFGSTLVAVKYYNEAYQVEKADVSDQKIKEKNEAGLQKNRVDKNDTAPLPPEVEIVLFNGKIIRGAIISREENYIVRTSKGEIKIPSKSIRQIKKIE